MAGFLYKIDGDGTECTVIFDLYTYFKELIA